jgi:hypothetical protein
MTNFIRDNTSPGDAKTDYRTTAIPASQKFAAVDYERFRQALLDIQTYLRSGLLDGAITTTLTDLDVVNNGSPNVGPEIDLAGNRARWFIGIDVANTPTSRDFVVTGQRGTYAFNDGATTSGSPTLTSASGGGFTTALIGSAISGSGIPDGTTVLAVGGATSLTMSANATATASGVTVTITRNTSTDLMYWKHRGGLPATLGVGVTPPDGLARLQVSPSDEEPAMATLRLRRASAQTGSVLAIHDATPIDHWWVDKDYWMSGSHGFGGAIAINADPVNQRAIGFSPNDKSILYDFSFPGGNVMRVSYRTGGTSILDLGSDGSFRHLSTKLGFYGATTVARQTIVALTDSTSGTANDTLQAIPDPADAPASADALRDDLVANALPAIRNDLADLAAKVNAIRTALANLGLVQ